MPHGGGTKRSDEAEAASHGSVAVITAVEDGGSARNTGVGNKTHLAAFEATA
ncbi:T9SS C-terminal target domain-containing protein [Sesbania bispinosa]|nr:T9SS C-terminal target domain-containing protein [Sesbania bispinosa]